MDYRGNNHCLWRNNTQPPRAQPPPLPAPLLQSNGDGEISYSEFQQGVKNHPDLVSRLLQPSAAATGTPKSASYTAGTKTTATTPHVAAGPAIFPKRDPVKISRMARIALLASEAEHTPGSPPPPPPAAAATTAAAAGAASVTLAPSHTLGQAAHADTEQPALAPPVALPVHYPHTPANALHHASSAVSALEVVTCGSESRMADMDALLGGCWWRKTDDGDVIGPRPPAPKLRLQRSISAVHNSPSLNRTPRFAFQHNSPRNEPGEERNQWQQHHHHHQQQAPKVRELREEPPLRKPHSPGVLHPPNPAFAGRITRERRASTAPLGPAPLLVKPRSSMAGFGDEESDEDEKSDEDEEVEEVMTLEEDGPREEEAAAAACFSCSSTTAASSSNATPLSHKLWKVSPVAILSVIVVTVAVLASSRGAQGSSSSLSPKHSASASPRHGGGML